MLIYYTQVSIDEGFEVMSQPKRERLVAGRHVSLASGKLLFEALRAAGEPLKCWSCGLEANCFIVNKGSRDLVGAPTLDLYADTGKDVVLMTRDHIIPKSYGGVNLIANLRVGCGPCNHGRGNTICAEDQAFMEAHPELIVPGFVQPVPPPPLTEEQKISIKAEQKRKRNALNRKRRAARAAREADPVRQAKRAARISKKVQT